MRHEQRENVWHHPAVAARVLLVLAGVCAAWAAWLTVAGGIDVHIASLRIRSNDPVRPLLLAALAFAAYATLTKDFSLQKRWAAWLDRAGHGRIALLISCGVTVLAICYSATTGIVSDSYGYVSQADLWARGNLFIPEPHVAGAPWPEAEQTFAPLGYRAVHADGSWAYVPIYSAGLPLFMAAARLVGGRELMFWIVPVFGGLLSLTTYAIGRRCGSTRAGLIACWLVATSPPVFSMMLQPMSDVPVAAAWVIAIFFALGRTPRDAACSGLASAVAILIRPNLAAVAVVLGVWWLLRRNEMGEGTNWRARVRHALVFAACAAPGVAATAALYQMLFGSPATSGYGHVSEMFSRQHVLPNIRHYFTWFLESQSRVTLVGIVALLLPIRALWPWVRERSALVMVLACLATIVVQYLLYLEFDAGQYVRFMLTCWPFIMLGVAAMALLVWRASRPIVSFAAAVVIIALGVQGVQHSRTTGAFRLWHNQRRPVEFARIVARETPASSVFYTVSQSGTLRYYAGRTTLYTDSLSPEWLDRSIAWLQSRGIAAYLAVEDSEIATFKKRFAGQTIAGTLDARLVLVYGREEPYRLYDLTRVPQAAPRQVEVGDLRALRSATPDPGAFEPQLGAVTPRASR